MLIADISVENIVSICIDTVIFRRNITKKLAYFNK